MFKKIFAFVFAVAVSTSAFAAGPFQGVWATQANGHQFLMKLNQNGNQIHGEVLTPGGAPYQPRIFITNGSVFQGQVNFYWSSANLPQYQHYQGNAFFQGGQLKMQGSFSDNSGSYGWSAKKLY